MKLKMIALLLITLLIGGCQSTPQASDDKIKIVTTMFPMTSLVNYLVEDQASVTQLLPEAGADAHTWEPSPQDIVLLEQADVFVYNGAGMEMWVDDVLESLTNENLTIINASKDIELVEGHSHDNDHDDHDHDHDHDDHDHGSLDPHTWSTPLNAKQQAQTIADALTNAYVELKDSVQTNLESLQSELDKVHQEYLDKLSSIDSKVLVVQHEAYGYLAHQYDLEQVGIEGLVPTSEPDPARMVEIINLVKDRSVKTIFFEENVSSKVADTLSNETGAKTAVLSTLAVRKDDLDLIEMMRDNLEILVEGLTQ